jgi:hypothetical protein
MNNKIPSITNLHNEKNNKHKSKTDIFNIVLTKCVEKIIYTNRFTDHTYIFFEVPKMLIGVPGYDMKSCIVFLMSELVKENYKVLFVEPFYIYIDWGTNTENYHSAKNNLDDIQKYIQTSNPEKLKVQTQKLLEKFPNTSKIVFEYQDNKNTNKHTSKKIKPKKK